MLRPLAVGTLSVGRRNRMGGGAGAREDERDRLNVRERGGALGGDSIGRVGEKMSGLSYSSGPSTVFISPEPRLGVGRRESIDTVLAEEGESDMGSDGGLGW